MPYISTGAIIEYFISKMKGVDYIYNEHVGIMFKNDISIIFHPDVGIGHSTDNITIGNNSYDLIYLSKNKTIAEQYKWFDEVINKKLALITK